MEPRPIIRTYLSNPPLRGSAGWALAGVAFLTLASWIYWENFLGLRPFLSATRAQVFEQGQYWRLFTAWLVHGDPQHLGANVPFFAGLAYLLRAYFGRRVFPALTLLAGTLIHGLSLLTYPDEVVLVGASGVVYFMAAFWLTLFFWIERPRRSLFRRLLSCIGLTLILLVPHAFEMQVSYRAHAIGYAVGLVLGAMYFFTRRAKFSAAEVRAEPAVGLESEPEPDEAGEGPEGPADVAADDGDEFLDPEEAARAAMDPAKGRRPGLEGFDALHVKKVPRTFF